MYLIFQLKSLLWDFLNAMVFSDFNYGISDLSQQAFEFVWGQILMY